MASWTPARGAPPALRRLVVASQAAPTTRTPTTRTQQRRWAQVHDVRFLATTHRRATAIADRYRDKLERRARDEGIEGGVEALREVYAERIRELRMRDAVAPGAVPPLPGVQKHGREEGEGATTTTTTETRSQSTPAGAPTSPKRPDDAAAAAAIIKPLSSMLDLDKARRLPARELASVWRLRHAGSPRALCAAIPAATYAAMEAAARRHPQFVLPVPHEGQGAEMHFLQWTFGPPPPPPTSADGGAAKNGFASTTSTVLFTQLAEFKTRGEFALPHTTLTHHTDLAADTGLVLMHGTVAEDRGVAVEHAQWLAVCLQRFYGGYGEGEEVDERAAERRRLVEWFARGDARFSVEKLMEEAERLA